MVNVLDFDIQVPPGDMLETIFNHQLSLMDKYHKIEMANTRGNIAVCSVSVGMCPLNLQDRDSQLQLKTFAWRVTEELTEATLALGDEDQTHYLEELIDALHFSVELLIMSDILPKDLVGTSDPIASPDPPDKLKRMFALHTDNMVVNSAQLRYRAYTAIEALGSAMNRLKLKPWKSTAILTDERAYRADIRMFFVDLIHLLKSSGFSPRTATAMYLNKNAVNQFRIRSNY